MVDIPRTLREVHRKAWGTGLAVCLIAPLLVLGLVAAGVLAPGKNPVEGAYQQVGYTFTGLVFLGSAWGAFRRARVLKAFAKAAAAERPGILQREALVDGALALTSTVWGVFYWMLVGQSALRHALTFVMLTPVMFLCLMPGLQVWAGAQKEVP